MFSPFAFPLQVTMSRRHCQARGLLLLMVLCGLAADLGHMYHMQADAKTASGEAHTSRLYHVTT